MKEIFENQYLLLTLTFVIFFVSKQIQKRTGLMIINPILITIAFMIGILVAFDIDYETYNQGGKYIEFWLKPAVVALGVPLYLQLENIKKQLLPIFISQMVGCVVGVVSVVAIAQALGATQEIIMSLVAKSVTTPIAIEVTKALGGIPSLTAAVVICVGIFGGMTGAQLLSLFRVRDTTAQGLSFGAASHAVGTDTAMHISEVHGAFASLAMIFNGLLTSLFAPMILELMGYQL